MRTRLRIDSARSRRQGWPAMAHDRQDLGFIGLGLMGQAFTKRMVACGHRVTGYDIVADKIARAGEHGVHAASSAAEVARASAIVHVSVMTKDDLAAAVFGPNGVAEGAARGKVLVDHSTTEVEATRQFAARLEADTGMRWVDAPVSGGPPAAEAGTLALMAGGDEADVAAVRPVLEHARDVHPHGAARRRAGHQDGQPGDRARQLLRAGRGAGAGRSGRRGREQDPRGARRRLRRQQHAPAPLSAAGRARLRAGRLCLPGAQGPRHGARPGQGAARCRRR